MPVPVIVSLPSPLVNPSAPPHLLSLLVSLRPPPLLLRTLLTFQEGLFLWISLVLAVLRVVALSPPPNVTAALLKVSACTAGVLVTSLLNALLVLLLVLLVLLVTLAPPGARALAVAQFTKLPRRAW